VREKEFQWEGVGSGRVDFGAEKKMAGSAATNGNCTVEWGAVRDERCNLQNVGGFILERRGHSKKKSGRKGQRSSLKSVHQGEMLFIDVSCRWGYGWTQRWTEKWF